MKRDAVEAIKNTIKCKADILGVKPCAVLADVVRSCLMSDDSDACHVHWLELFNDLEDVLMRNADVVITK